MDEPGDDDVAPRDRAPRDDGRRLEVNGVQVCASALAAVTAAVIGSFFGVTGTIAGAGLASVFATIGSAVYSHFLRRGGARLQHVEVPVLANTLGRVTSVTTTTTLASRATRDRGGTDRKDGGDDSREPSTWRRRLAGRRGVVAAIALVFVLAMVAITGIELVTQRPLSGVAGRDSSGLTSIGEVLPGSPDDGGPRPSTTTTTGEGSDATTTTTTGDTEPAPSTSPEGDATSTTAGADDGGDSGDGLSEPTTSTTASTGTTAASTTTAPSAGAAAPSDPPADPAG